MRIGQLICALLCTLLTVAVHAQDKGKDNSKLLGAWAYTAPDAPYGYQDGTVHFKQSEGKLSAELKANHSTVAIKEVVKKGEVYSCDLYVDGSPVSLSFQHKGDALEGTANTEVGSIPVTLKRAKK